MQRDWELLAQKIPRGVNSVLDQLQNGNLTVRVKQSPLEISVNRLAYGLCTSALLLASAMLWTHHAPPTVAGVSILGAVGYVFAMLLFARLYWLIQVKKKKDDQ